MGRKNKTAVADVPAVEIETTSPKGGANKSAGVERPFKARNLKRLSVIAGYLTSMMNDFARAGDSDAWVRSAKSSAGDVDSALGEIYASLQVAPDNFATRKTTNRKAATADFAIGGSVNLTEAGHAKYDASKVGALGDVGTVLDIQTGGLLVQFTASPLPQFIRGAHLIKAE